MLCDHECYMIGGPWIAENPNCPIHGRNELPDNSEEKREVLYRLWCREINADEAFDILENL